MERYLKLCATSPLWRNDFWIEHQPDYKRKITYYKSNFTEKKQKITRDWQSYKEKSAIKFQNISDLTERFIEYLFQNEKNLNEKQKKEMDNLMGYFHLSMDSSYLMDNSLNKPKK